MKKKKQHYVDNKKLLIAMTEFKESVESAKLNETPRPRVPPYIVKVS